MSSKKLWTLKTIENFKKLKWKEKIFRSYIFTKTLTLAHTHANIYIIMYIHNEIIYAHIQTPNSISFILRNDMVDIGREYKMKYQKKNYHGTEY